MIDHITFGVSDFARSVAFYDAAFAPLGITRLHSGSPEEDGAAFTGYDADHPFFWIVAERATRGMLHIAIRASDRGQVDDFHAAALQAGGRDNGAPGLRPHYHAHYYGAFAFDPDGHNIEAVCHMPEG